MAVKKNDIINAINSAETLVIRYINENEISYQSAPGSLSLSTESTIEIIQSHFSNVRKILKLK